MQKRILQFWIIQKLIVIWHSLVLAAISHYREKNTHYENIHHMQYVFQKNYLLSNCWCHYFKDIEWLSPCQYVRARDKTLTTTSTSKKKCTNFNFNLVKQKYITANNFLLLFESGVAEDLSLTRLLCRTPPSYLLLGCSRWYLKALQCWICRRICWMQASNPYNISPDIVILNNT